MKEKRALIFGADGFAAGYLTKELLENGYEVFGSDVCSRNEHASMSGFYVCDLLDADAVASLICEVRPTHVVNLAAISSVGYSWKAPQQTMQVNVCGTLNILEAVRRLDNFPDILLIGSSEEYAVSTHALDEDSALEANNPYGISKAVQEQFARLYSERFGMKIHYVRAFNHTGIGQSDKFVIPSWCRQTAEISASGRPGTINVGNTDVCRDFSHVADVVRAYRLVMEKGDPARVYNVGSGTAVKLSALLEYIVALSYQPITINADTDLFRPEDNAYICCDSSRIREELGWVPKYSIFDAVRQLYNHYIEAVERR